MTSRPDDDYQMPEPLADLARALERSGMNEHTEAAILDAAKAKLCEPSSLLTEAADRISALGAQAEHQVWWFDEKMGCVRDRNGDLVTDSGAEGKWIAAMSPAVAEPLETWLRQAARELEQAWRLFAPGTRRFGLTPDGSVFTTMWTEDSRWEAIQPRWGGALGVAAAILGTRSPAEAPSGTAHAICGAERDAPEGMSLHDRLVSVATTAVGLSPEDDDFLSRSFARGARLSATAVLRQAVAELRTSNLNTSAGDYGRGWQAAHQQICRDLESWAEMISEQGEGTSGGLG